MIELERYLSIPVQQSKEKLLDCIHDNVDQRKKLIEIQKQNHTYPIFFDYCQSNTDVYYLYLLPSSLNEYLC